MSQDEGDTQSAASSRSPAASTALLEQLASPTAVPTASPTPRAQRFDAIDDDNASSCYAYETAQYGVAACNATDTAFCESVILRATLRLPAP